MSMPSTLAGAERGDPASLELTPDDMRRLGEEALSRIVAHVAAIAEQPVRGDVAAQGLC